MVNFRKLIDESLEDFILRLADTKKINKQLTWQCIADNIYLNYGILKSEAWVRNKVKKLLSLAQEDELVDSLSEIKNQINQKTFELRKERAKLADQRSQINADVRKIAREETIKEIALEVASQMSRDKLLPEHKYDPVVEDFPYGNEAILYISDWHYGLDFKNPWNEFSPDICRQRIDKLREKAISYIKRHGCKKVHLVNLGDLIAGRIHLTIRLESKYDVITQTLHISEILAEFISDLSNYAVVDYYDCIDNHSRLEPDKKASQDLESLARIIPWYLKERLKNNQKVSIKENDFGYDLITFNCLGHKIAASHGHDDKPNQCIDDISLLTRQHYDLICMAHRHHFNMDEKDQCRLLCNGSLMGSDGYALKLRKHSKPSQTLVIASEENVCEAIYIIELN